MTKLIYKYEGSLGSRLHHQEKTFISLMPNGQNREKWETFWQQTTINSKNT